MPFQVGLDGNHLRSWAEAKQGAKFRMPDSGTCRLRVSAFASLSVAGGHRYRLLRGASMARLMHGERTNYHRTDSQRILHDVARKVRSSPVYVLTDCAQIVFGGADCGHQRRRSAAVPPPAAVPPHKGHTRGVRPHTPLLAPTRIHGGLAEPHGRCRASQQGGSVGSLAFALP